MKTKERLSKRCFPLCVCAAYGRSAPVAHVPLNRVSAPVCFGAETGQNTSRQAHTNENGGKTTKRKAARKKTPKRQTGKMTSGSEWVYLIPALQPLGDPCELPPEAAESCSAVSQQLPPHDTETSVCKGSLMGCATNDSVCIGIDLVFWSAVDCRRSRRGGKIGGQTPYAPRCREVSDEPG